jgi:beta-glucosidase
MDRRDFIKTSAAAAAITATERAGAVDTAPTGPLAPDEIERRVTELLGQMTLDEKIAQMSGEVAKNQIGFSRGYGKYNTIDTPANKRLGIPGIRFLDGPRGINRKGSTCLPSAIARGASWDVDLTERIGDALGYEARAWGANYFGGVCINLIRHPSMGRSQETFGEDPCLLGHLGVAEIKGLQRHVMACTKHFAANSIERSRHFVDVRMDERTLREVYLPHFKMCADAGSASFMSAYNTLNGELCGHNHHLLTDILKNEWGYQGFVLSDFGSGVKATVPAVNAGLDVEMPMTEWYGPRLKAAVSRGDVAPAVIDAAVTRILRQKLRFLHLENAPGYDRAKIAGPEHAALAREAEQKAIVLLKNDSRALPLDPAVRKIAVLGELADQPSTGDRGSSTVRPPYVITPLAGIRERAAGMEVIYESGANLAAAQKAAAAADAVIVIAGCNWSDEGEGIDRLRLTLSDAQERLILAAASANPRTIVVLEGGGAIITENWRSHVPAILMAWYPGMEGGRAIADVLFGDVNPSAKLPLTFPQSLDQLPYFSNTDRSIDYGYYHGYRLFDQNHLTPAFPFGHGLSYTTFKYSNPRLASKSYAPTDTITVHLDLTNTGPLPGAEIIQLYASYPNSKIDRPPKELKSFARISLAPNETQTVTLTLPASSLAYYDPATSSWVLDRTDYLLLLGPSSAADSLLPLPLKISGL